MNMRPQPKTVYANGFTAGSRYTSCRTRVVEYENGNQVVQVQRTAREPKNFSIPLEEIPDFIKELQRIVKEVKVND